MRWSAGWRDDEGAWRTHTTVGWTMDGEPASGRRGEVETEPISRERKHAARLLLLDNGACSAGTHESSQPSSQGRRMRAETRCLAGLLFRSYVTETAERDDQDNLLTVQISHSSCTTRLSSMTQIPSFD